MTEMQAKIQIAKMNGLIDELELLRDNGKDKTVDADDIKKEIRRIQKKLTKDSNAPILPAYFYDVGSGAYTAYEV